MKYIILIAILGALIYAPCKVKTKKVEPEIVIIGHFTHDKRLQDAGDFGRKLDTAIQRKMKNIKWESDKYR